MTQNSGIGRLRLAAAAISLCLCLVATVRPAAAQTINEGPALLSLSGGWFDFIKQNDQAAEFRLLYRHDDALWIMRPWAGLLATSDSAAYPMAGILTDFGFGDHWVITPSVGVGAYFKGDGLDLGGVFEIMSQLEVSYRFDNEMRIGVGFSHISNAHTSNRNTGAESLNVTFSIPLSR